MTAVQAAIYCRISLAVMGDTTKVDDQERQCREKCRQLGWDVVEVYTDNSRSAWQRTRKRPGWERMLADIGAGRAGAVCTYWGDRLVRQPRDLEDLLDLQWDSRGRRVRDLQYASIMGYYDFNNPDHVMMLRNEVNRACNESDTISRRKKNQYDRYRREGRVRPGGPGGRSFGFLSDNLTPVAAEFDLVREAASRILAGESLYSVCKDWSARGLTATTGKPWRRGNLGPMLKLPRYAGLMPDGESAAAWPAALDRETWERLRLAVDARAGFNPSPGNARRWLLSGIAEGGAPCGHLLQIGKSGGSKGDWSYVCAAAGCGKIRRNAPHLDAFVGAAVVSALANPLNPEGHAVPVDHAAEWAALERERAEADELLSDPARSAGRAKTLTLRLDAIDERMGELRGLAADDSRTRLLERYAGISREDWEGLALDVRRALVAACFRVTVLPASGRGPGFRVQDVRLEPVS